MSDRKRANLKRLLSPRHIAVVGGEVAATAARLSRAEGFEGDIWGIHPRRRDLGGAPVFASVAELPDAPDAVFIAVPRDPAIEVLAQLRERGAGGAVVYTAGFRELGEEGAGHEQRLIAAAGEMAVVGPNCFGLLNYLKGAVLWPYGHGGERVEKGVAIVSQSGMLTSNMTMGRRHLPFAYMISSGNQSVLGVEDYLPLLIEDPAVTGIGLYIEELRDIPGFAAAAEQALAAAVPIVVQKAGRSAIAAKLTASHTGSLSGDDELYQALFDRLGVIRVETPAAMMEALKALTIAGPLRGRRIAAFTGSGGDAAMLADAAERLGLEFPQPSAKVRGELADQLPTIATLSNPLDYTTALWGREDPLAEVIATQLSDGYSAALIVQDYPKPPLSEDLHLYRADSAAFTRATRAAEIPAAICSAIPETHNDEACAAMLAAGVAPLQGIDQALEALAAAARYGEALQAGTGAGFALAPLSPLPAEIEMLDEWHSKRRLAAAGLAVPAGRLVGAADVTAAAAALGFPVALKAVAPGLAHKTEAGAVALALEDEAAVATALARMAERLAAETYLVERMAPRPVAELLVGLRRDPAFGLALVLGSGGVLVELVADARTILLPASREDLRKSLEGLKVWALLEGHRGGPAADIEALLDALEALTRFALEAGPDFVELEINPLFVLERGVLAIDVLLHQAKGS